MTLRPRFLIALVAMAVAAVALVGLRAAQASADGNDLATVRTVAAKVGTPVASTVSTNCHGDGLIACWSVQGQAKVIAADMQRLVTAAGGIPTTTCDSQQFGTGPASVAKDSCQVIYRKGSHVVAVFIDPAPGTEYSVSLLAS